MRFLALSLLALLLISISHASDLDPYDGEEEIIAKSLRSLTPNTRKNVIVELESQLERALEHPSLTKLEVEERRLTLIDILRDFVKEAQADLMKLLDRLGLFPVAEPFWITNTVFVRNASSSHIEAISRAKGVIRVREPVVVRVPTPTARKEECLTGGPQWGVSVIKADQVWKGGNTGKGIVVGIIDSGVNVEHEALKGRYRGGTNSWLDSFGEHATPYDGNGHGTHCAGTICGETNGIGVAPGAQWIACRGLNDTGSGSEENLLKCGEFMSCPQKDCKGIPHIVSNSWGGSGGLTFFNKVIKTWQKLGITPVFAIGNEGKKGCFSAGSPGDQPNLISVGATNKTGDKLATFSSRGPPRGFNLFKTKPEVSAPGVDICSANTKDPKGYIVFSGTSMATPHVAGSIALMLAAKNDAKFAEIEKALESTTVKPRLTLQDTLSVCSLTPRYPNNGYGHGRIDVLAAIKALTKS